MPTRDSGARARPDLRDNLWFRIGVVAALLVLILAVSRGCQSADKEIDQDEAVEIAVAAVDFEPDPDRTQVRLIRQGVSFDARWFVGLAQTGSDGGQTNVTVVEIDADTGEILSIRRP